jgi:DNA polymerase-3 subunit beta
MSFTITRQNLHNGLAAVSASIPSKTTLPVLSTILFEAKDDGVWMSGTDLDVAVRVKVLADVKEPGSLTAPGKKLQEFTRELPDHPDEVATRGEQIELKCGRSHFKLNGLPADEFPTIAEVDFSDGLTVSGKELNALIHHTSFAVSTEE